MGEIRIDKTGVGELPDFGFVNLQPLTLTADQTPLPSPPVGRTGYRLESDDNDYEIRSIAAGTDGQILLLFNADPFEKKFKLKHEDTNELVLANRISCWGGGDKELEKWESIMIRYDGTLQRWHLLFSRH